MNMGVGKGNFMHGLGSGDNHELILVDNSTPCDALIDKEELSSREKLMDLRDAERRGFNAALEWIFMDGFHDPRRIAQRCYVIVHKVRHDLINYGTCAEIARLFGETRAMHSFRVQKTFDEWLAARGARGVSAPWQKSSAHKIKLSVSAKGNNSRKKGCRKG